MKYIFKIIILLITFNLVSCNKISFDSKQSLEQKQINFIDRKPGTPLSRSALGRLAENITVEIVTRSVVSGGDPFSASGSGVIIGKKDFIYYVLTAKHVVWKRDDYRVVVRSKKPGEDAEILKMEIIYLYPNADLAVLKFASLKQYKVVEVGEVSQLRKDSQVYVVGWPGVENRDGFQFTPAKVTNPRAGDLLTYEPNEAGEGVYPGMSGGAVLNETGQLEGIHVGLTELDGDGKGVLVSTFLREIPQEVEKLLVRSNSVEIEENLTVIVPDDIPPSPTQSFDLWWLFYGTVIIGGGSLIYFRLRYFQKPQVFKQVNKFQKQIQNKQSTKKETENKSNPVQKTQSQKKRKLENPTKNKSSQLPKPPSVKESDKGELFTFEVVRVDDSGSIINRSQESARQKIENLGNGIKLEMVYIPGGSFLMGSPETEAERNQNESPQHKVTLLPFYMSKFPITQEQYQAIVDDNPANFKGDNRPVEFISWNDATEFCQKLSKKIGKKYSLPSESQWEYACRAGTTTPFYFGETITPELVNYDGNYTYANALKGEYKAETTPVSQFPPNAFGLYDMHGNVWEWCADECHENYNGAPVDGSAWVNGGNSHKRVLRGGSWENNSGNCRSARRDYVYADYLNGIRGFRVVSSSPFDFSFSL